jgi:alkyl hydroperoxide reductase subunit F
MKMMQRDPVCKMEVREEEALTMEFGGELYYFCSEGCRDRFLKEHPEKTSRYSYELIIIGGGPAGLTAAVYASLMRVDTFVITKDLGGQAYDSSKIENYMGYDFITGPELISKFKDQLFHSHYVDHKVTEAEKIEPADGSFTVITSELEEYKAKALIVATGMTRRKLNLPGEERFQRKGVFYGNIQDYSFVQGEDVAVIGGGNSALQIVENMHTIAGKIHLISEYELTADHSQIERVDRYKNLLKYENVKVLQFSGDRFLTEILARKKATNELISIPVTRVFISIGLKPNTGLFANLVKLNEKKEIIIDQDCSTSFPGIFAAGDVTNAFGKRIIIASGEGAKAAMAVRKYILDMRKKAEAKV